MPRKFLKRWLPDAESVRRRKYLGRLGAMLQAPDAWHLNRRSAAGGVAVGLFLAFVPVPFQMPLAAAVALVLRVNVPLAIVSVWVTNPLTIPPFAYLAYRVGTWVLDVEVGPPPVESDLFWLLHYSGRAWKPLLAGSLLLAAAASVLGFVAVRLGWRLYVLHRRWRRARTL